MRKLFLLILFMHTFSTFADCPMANLYKGKNDFMEWRSYETCATELNDSEAQFLVAQTYLNGNKNVTQNLRSAMKYFRLASENGYAPAQRELAKLMDSLNDLGKDGVEAIAEIEEDWQKQNEIKRQPMPALSWLMLAAERPENKWFYLVEPSMDKEAASLLPSMKTKYGNEEVKKASLLATQWKQEQLMKQAKSLLTERAYKQFENIIYPSKLEPPKMTREQAVEELKKIKMSKRK